MFLCLNNGNLMALNIGEGTVPYLAGCFPFRISDFAFEGNLLYLVAGNAGLVVLRAGE